MSRLKTTLNPAWFQGRHRREPYFEGWYFKLIDATTRHRYAIIPGVFLSQDPHAFIQVLDGEAGTATYHRFPLEMFWAAEDRFEIHIGGNRFGTDGMILNIESPEQTIRGEIRLGDLEPWPVTVASPGIMGWYAWVPTMECYHGVVSLDHRLYGSLEIDEQTVAFDEGRGYIEKDWGQSFPQAWVWMQTNHFEQPGTCLTASTAVIPWRKSAFLGFIVGLWHEGQLYRFATYTGAKTERLTVTEEKVNWVLSSNTHRLHILAHLGDDSHYGLLKGPSTVEMGKRVAETLSATVWVSLTDLAGKTLFEGNGRFAGLEVYNAEALLKLHNQ